MGTRKERGRTVRMLVAAGKIIFVAACFLTVMGVSGYLTIRQEQVGARVEVPDVTGMTLEEAAEALGPRSLFVDVAAEKHDARMEEGRILAQEPPAGGPIKKFRKVKVVTSLGPKVYTVPDLRGQLLRSALIALEAEGLRPGRIAYAHSRLAEPDVVVAQDPPPDGESLGHAGVSLLVSQGSRDPVYVMPSLKGLTERQVESMAEEHGLRLGSVRRELDPWIPRGQVSQQYPEAGYPVARGDSISIVVSY